MIKLTSFKPVVDQSCELCGDECITSKSWRDYDHEVYTVKVKDLKSGEIKESAYTIQMNFEKRVCVQCALSAIYQMTKK